MTVTLSPQIRKAITPWIKEYGYGSTKDFIEDAIQHRLLELKKSEFSEHTKVVQKAMSKQKITMAGILDDFEKQRT